MQSMYWKYSAGGYPSNPVIEKRCTFWLLTHNLWVPYGINIIEFLV